MFTGIVEEVGRVLSHGGSRLVVGARTALEGSGSGASVAVNGACLTVVERGPDRLAFDLGPETLKVTALGDLHAGDPVNLERPLRLGDFVGGHLVQGHVDAIGVAVAVARQDDTARVRVEWQDTGLGALLIPKGSVAVDGVSLTVAMLDERAFEVMLIPHTLQRTTLGHLTPGRRVNLEMDMIGKYVLRALDLGARAISPRGNPLGGQPGEPQPPGEASGNERRAEPERGAAGAPPQSQKRGDRR